MEEITVHEVARWLNRNKDKIVINIIGGIGVLQIDEAIYCIQDECIIINAKRAN